MTDTKTDNTALTDLIQLPDGNWIDPTRVVGLIYMRPVPPIAGVSNSSAGHRIQVEFSGHSLCVPFDSEKDATEFRDDLARKVNAAKSAMRMRETQSAPLGGVGGGGGSHVSMNGQPVTYESSGGGGGGGGWPWYGISSKAPGVGGAAAIPKEPPENPVIGTPWLDGSLLREWTGTSWRPIGYGAGGAT